MFPLMDMFFILLLFYLALARIEPPTTPEEVSLYATPNDDVGEAQIFIQIINRDSVLWLDYGSFSGWDGGSGFITDNIWAVSDLQVRFTAFKESLGQCIGKTIDVVVRCPDDIAFGDILRFQEDLTGIFSAIIPDKECHYSLSYGSTADLFGGGIEFHDNGDVTINFR